MATGIEMQIDTGQLEKIRKSFGEHANIFDAELKRAETAGLTVLRDEARSRASAIASDGRLPNSITFETVSGGLAGIVGSVAKTGPSIETGRRPGEQPSVELLANWAGRRGLAAGERYSVKTHRRLKATKAVRAAELDLAWKIAMTIKERGTKPLPFIIPAAQARAQQIESIFSDAVNRALRKLASV